MRTLKCMRKSGIDVLANCKMFTCHAFCVTRVSVVVRRTSSEHFASSEHCSEHFAVCEHASVRIQLLLSKQFASTQACGYSCFSASVRIQLLLCKRADTAASLQARQTMFRPLNFVCEPRDGKVDVDEAYQLVLTMYIQINRQAPIDPPPRPLVLPKCCDIFRSC